MKMFRIQLLQFHAQNQEDLKLKNRQLIDADTEIMEMLELSDKYFKADRINMLK